MDLFILRIHDAYFINSMEKYEERNTSVVILFLLYWCTFFNQLTSWSENWELDLNEVKLIKITI